MQQTAASDSQMRNETLFTKSGLFGEFLNVTVHNDNDKRLEFALSVSVGDTDFSLEVSVANYTVIPLDSCNDGDDDEGLNGMVLCQPFYTSCQVYCVPLAPL